MSKKIDLSNLPKKIWTGVERIDWMNSMGHKIKGIYYGVEFEVKIISYDKGYLYVKYLDNTPMKISRGSFSRCELGELLNKRTGNFKIDITHTFKDTKRNITIIDREIRLRYKKDGNFKCNDKYYKYRCNKCGNEDWILESSLITRNVGCNVCGQVPKKIVLGINTIWDKYRWMCNLGISEEDAKTHTFRSENNIVVTCPNCGNKKYCTPSNIYLHKSIGCICGDGFSYPEKFVYSTLKQLSLIFKTQLNKTTFKWCKDYKYDFYIPEYNIIIETHGTQHYKKSSSFKRTLEEEQENDKLKKELALANGIKEEDYIVIDCRKSELEFIKNNILNSKLNNIFDLSTIDWLKNERFSLSNLVKEVCIYWEKNKFKNIFYKDIINIFGLSTSTIKIYLEKGTKQGWCNYNIKPKNRHMGRIYPVMCLETQIIYKNSYECSEDMSKIYNKIFRPTNILSICNPNTKDKTYKTFTFRYATEEEYDKFVADKSLAL